MVTGEYAKPTDPVWIVCQDCTFGMRCDSQLDAHELASRHLTNYGCKRVDVVVTSGDYNRLMSDKQLSPGTPVYQNHRHHRLSDTRRALHSRRLL
jgi:hypothetical protein